MSLEGFAADGVAQVELVRLDGVSVARAVVADNTFAVPVSGTALRDGLVFIARNSDGDEVYRRSFLQRG
jgi:hypothetical protein